MDIGLRLDDVQQMALESELVEYETKKDPKENLEESGATEEERNFLVERRNGEGWIGKRVELNAMTSPQFIAWLERKFKEHGDTKLIPHAEVLNSGYRRAFLAHRVNQEMKRLADSLRKEPDTVAVPKDLAGMVKRALKQTAEMSWDAAISHIVSREIEP